MIDGEYVTVTEAQEMIGVSRPRIAQILKDGTLKWERSPVDRRVKLIKRSDVEYLVVRSGGRKKKKARESLE